MASTSARSPFFFRGHRETPEHRFGERLSHRGAFIGIIGDRAIVQIRLDQQHFGADALKAHDARGAQLAAVEADVIGADAGGQGSLVEKFGVPLVDFQPELARLGIPIEVEVAGQFCGVLVFSAMVGVASEAFTAWFAAGVA